jgi:hypothetical protein
LSRAAVNELASVAGAQQERINDRETEGNEDDNKSILGTMIMGCFDVDLLAFSSIDYYDRFSVPGTVT